MRINDRRLSEEEFDYFVNALRDAFSLREFQTMLSDKLGWHHVLDMELDEGFFTRMLTKAEYDDKTRELLVAALEKKPGNRLLKDFAHQVGFSLQNQPQNTSVPDVSANSPNQPPVGPFERQVSELHSSLDPVHFRNMMEERERQICLITVVGWEKVYGTGFLVGPGVVMTNYHVLEKVIDGQIPTGRVSFSFDYKFKEDGKTLETGYECTLAGDDWLLDHSEFDDLDWKITEHCANVDARHLDYALLRLNRRIGDEFVEGVKRGWVEVLDMEYSFKLGTALLVLHHPKGGKLTFDMDTRSILEENTTKTRVRYTTNTERGSSGAPCFNSNWELVAIHQTGDPDFSHQANYNQGIPIDAILARLRRQGKGRYLGDSEKKKR